MSSPLVSSLPSKKLNKKDDDEVDTRFKIAAEFSKVDPKISASLFAVTTITLLAAGFTTEDVKESTETLTETALTTATFSPTETFFNILDTALPGSSADVVALAVGEASAGLIAALALFFARFLGGLIPRTASFSDSDSEDSAQPEETLSSAEYFLASSFLTPAFSSLGLSSVLAVLVSSIPSSYVKQQSKQKSIKSTEQPKDKSFNSTDIVEAATDVTKWLEYSVLTKNYRGLISTLISPLGYYSSWSSRFIESFIFGVICAASTELYKDTVYFYSEIDEGEKL
ncbi:hypothetical protein TL16_g07092 [Triparma laevis f. inornata]|uniref:Uncharacterized protein n=1 Tax=Triparma laevis f. inornata TaxID=1714386 RepID=A0A9W7EFW1_9STRA|nr:hypothetical protein TL16_g07092 [Triparma laevis f. inornata]